MDIKIIFLIAVLVTLGFFVYKTRKRKGISNLFLCLFVILFTLLLSELIYRTFFREKHIISTVNMYYKMDSLIGFRFDPGRIEAIEHFENGDTIYNTHYTFLSDTNRYGTNYPMRKGFKSDTSSKETVFLGCSLTMGEGLADEESLPYQYGLLTGVSTVNRGFNGMGVNQVYQLFKSEYANQDNHHRVFVYSYFSEHFFRAHGMYSWNVAGPEFVISADTLLNKGPFYKGETNFGHKLAHYGSFLGAFTLIKDNIERMNVKRIKRKLTENDLAPYFLMFRQMAEMIRRTGGQFILLNWDDPITKTGSPILDKDIADKKVRQVINHTGAIILDVSSAIDRTNPDNFIPNDGHPSAVANKALAEYIAKNRLLIP